MLAHGSSDGGDRTRVDTPSALAMVVFSALSLTLLSFALNVKGFEVGVVYAVWSGVGMAFIVTMEIFCPHRAGSRVRRQLGSRPTRDAPCPRQPSHSASLASPLSCWPGTGGAFTAT